MNIRRLESGSAPTVWESLHKLHTAEIMQTDPPPPEPSLPTSSSGGCFHTQLRYSPEPLGLVVEGARVSAVGGLVELRQKGLAGLLAGVVGELDRDGLGCP